MYEDNKQGAYYKGNGANEMKKQQKIIFLVLCIVMVLVNGFISIGHLGGGSIDQFIGGGIGGSVLSIPIWSCIGVIVSKIGLFFYKIKNPRGGEVLSNYQKASLGLLLGIVFKPMLGIVW